MRIAFLAAALLLSMAGCQKAEEPAATPLADDAKTVETTDTITMAEPKADKRPHEMTLHDITRVDDYYWLRDDERADPEVLAYLEAENEWFDAAMAPTEKLQETLYEEMVARLDPDDSGVPYEKDGWWYYYRYEPEKDYAIYARRKGNMDARGNRQ